MQCRLLMWLTPAKVLLVTLCALRRSGSRQGDRP